MKILFLGYAVPEEKATKLSGASVAGNKMQINILKNLYRYQDVDLEVLSIFPIAAFPREHRWKVKREKIQLVEKLNATVIPFLNLPIIKQFSQTISMYRYARKIVKKDRDTLLFTFNLFPQIGLPTVWLKKKYKCKTLCLLADLPIDDNTMRKGLSCVFRKIFEQLTIYAQEKCDKFILLNKHVKDYFNISDDYIVIDGGIDEKDIINLDSSYNPQKKNIVYSGALTDYSGILLLVEAVKQLDYKHICLDIYGEGYLLQQIIDISKEYENINYYGKVSHNEIISIQKKAWLLANPRIIDNYISKVTFPSKIFEYMLSSTPVLSSKLNGFGAEYSNYLFFYEEDNSNIIRMSIEKIFNLSKEDLQKFGLLAKRFIVENKSWKKQTEKIYKYIINYEA